MIKRWAVQVVLKNGESDYVCHGEAGTEIAVYHSRIKAEALRAFILEGISSGEVQSVNVVEAPTVGRGSRRVM